MPETNIPDNPIDRADIDQLTDEQLDEMLQVIRDRRLKLLRAFEEAETLREAELEDDQRDDLEKMLQTINTDMKSLDTKIEKIEKKINKIRALRLAIEE
jgi:uncharacterized protein YlxW (UPF0749 family)